MSGIGDERKREKETPLGAGVAFAADMENIYTEQSELSLHFIDWAVNPRAVEHVLTPQPSPHMHDIFFSVLNEIPLGPTRHAMVE